MRQQHAWSFGCTITLMLCLYILWARPVGAQTPPDLYLSTSHHHTPPRLELALKTGNLRSISLLGAFIPLYDHGRGLWFANLFGLLDSQSSQEANLGLGYRHLLGDKIVGAYGFWDRRKSGHGHLFSQWTWGLKS